MLFWKCNISLYSSCLMNKQRQAITSYNTQHNFLLNLSLSLSHTHTHTQLFQSLLLSLSITTLLSLLLLLSTTLIMFHLFENPVSLTGLLEAGRTLGNGIGGLLWWRLAGGSIPLNPLKKCLLHNGQCSINVSILKTTTTRNHGYL